MSYMAIAACILTFGLVLSVGTLVRRRRRANARQRNLREGPNR